jgi:hypothetical protein
MKTDAKRLFKIWGWNTQGDFGPYTCYTDKRKKLVIFLRAPPRVPASPWQRRNRDRLKAIAAKWRALAPATRCKWSTAATKAHLRISGYNLYTFWQTRRDDQIVRTIEHQTGIHLLS